jgi:hypothetical protein
MNVTVGSTTPGVDVSVSVGEASVLSVGDSTDERTTAATSLDCGVGVTYTATGVGLTQAAIRSRQPSQGIV